MKALYVREDSIYKDLLGDENCYDKIRDAKTYKGNGVVIAHPPCRAWGVLWWSANPEIGGPELALEATNHIIKYGGVLEHPIGSMLFRVMFAQMKANGFFVKVNQFNFGHSALKPTKLFISGCSERELPPIPKADGRPKYCIGGTKGDVRPSIPKGERDITPVAFAKWLIEVASIIERNRINKGMLNGLYEKQ